MKLGQWCLAALLVAAAGSAVAQELLVVDAGSSPGGKIWRVSGPGAAPQPIFEWEDQIMALGTSAGRLLFTDTSYQLYELSRGSASALYETKRQWIRDMVVGPDGAVYFSFASGGSADGAIYRLPDAPGSPAALLYTVRLKQVAGHWNGHFALVPATGRERPPIFLSSGMVEPGRLYRVRAERGDYQAPELLVELPGQSIAGFFVTGSGDLYYADNAQGIWKLSPPGYSRPQGFTKLPDFQRAIDVAAPPGR